MDYLTTEHQDIKIIKTHNICIHDYCYLSHSINAECNGILTIKNGDKEVTVNCIVIIGESNQFYVKLHQDYGLLSKSKLYRFTQAMRLSDRDYKNYGISILINQYNDGTTYNVNYVANLQLPILDEFKLPDNYVKVNYNLIRECYFRARKLNGIDYFPCYAIINDEYNFPVDCLLHVISSVNIEILKYNKAKIEVGQHFQLWHDDPDRFGFVILQNNYRFRDVKLYINKNLIHGKN